MHRNGARRVGGASLDAGPKGPVRGPFTFELDKDLVDRARREVGERDMVRSIEAALVAAIDYEHWVREISRGEPGTYS